MEYWTFPPRPNFSQNQACQELDFAIGNVVIHTSLKFFHLLKILSTWQMYIEQSKQGNLEHLVLDLTYVNITEVTDYFLLENIEFDVWRRFAINFLKLSHHSDMVKAQTTMQVGESWTFPHRSNSRLEVEFAIHGD